MGPRESSDVIENKVRLVAAVVETMNCYDRLRVVDALKDVMCIHCGSDRADCNGSCENDE